MTAIYRHEALLYSGVDEFVTGTLPFIREGLEQGEPVLVAVSGEKVERLRDLLGTAEASVEFADMTDVGRNPACIISIWGDFLASHCAPGVRRRGVGEPLDPKRSPAALTECARHEELLNIAFEEGANFWLLCPYDVGALAPSTVDGAGRSHPFLSAAGRTVKSAIFPGREALAEMDDDPLASPPTGALRARFTRQSVSRVREWVGRFAHAHDLGATRVAELQIATSELASNCVLHGRGNNEVILWLAGDELCCEFRNRGQLFDPLVGRRRPALDALDGRGLWIVNPDLLV